MGRDDFLYEIRLNVLVLFVGVGDLFDRRTLLKRMLKWTYHQDQQMYCPQNDAVRHDSANELYAAAPSFSDLL